MEMRRSKKKSTLSKVISDYFSNTTIHGINYLGDKDANKIEKIWWIIVFVISVIICSCLIANTWTKWKQNPVIVSFAQKQTSVWDIPFPAITICPLNKVRKPVYDYSDVYLIKNTLEGSAKKKFWDISQICNLKGVNAQNTSDLTDEDIVTNIREVSPTLQDIIQSTIWQSVLYNQPGDEVQFYSTQLTSDGICFTFNSLAQDDIYTNEIKQGVEFISKNNKKNTGWSIEQGYPKTTLLNAYPERTSQNGVNFGISIGLRSMLYDRELHCGETITGFKVALHNPAELPRLNHQYFFVPLRTHVTVSVTPDIITTSDGLLDIPVRVRKCFFQHEKKLRFFQFYTQNNCRIECLANVTKEFCGCLPFYMPRDNLTAICGYGKIECVKNVYKKITVFEMILQNNLIDKNEESSNLFQIYKMCECIPSCSSLAYHSQTSEANYYYVKSLYKEVLFSGDEFKEMRDEMFAVMENIWDLTELLVFFKDNQVVGLHRQELYSQTDFLANCGGLLGLFMGFSFLSLLEIIYFVTLRLWFYMRQNKTPTI